MKINKMFFVISIFVTISFNAYAATIHVPTDYPTIQGAIDAAVNGDTILVASGTYVENINFNGKAITLQSENGAENTIIDGNQSGSVVVFSSGEQNTTLMEGFKIMNGNAYNGGGVYCSNSNPIINNCIISDNYAVSGGGGIYLNHSQSPIKNCKVFMNNANYGAGAHITNWSMPAFIDSIISGNIANYNGGGFYTTSNVSIIGSTITENSADEGGGVYCGNAGNPPLPHIHTSTISRNNARLGGGIYSNGNGGIFLQIYGCTISENHASDGAGLYLLDTNDTRFENSLILNNDSSNNGGGIWINRFYIRIVNATISQNTAVYEGGGVYGTFSANEEIINTIIWNNLAPINPDIDVYGVATYSDIKGGWSGTGNIDLDPLFVDPDNDNFHLSLLSPCIDSGSPAVGYSREPEPNGDRINMGAYGNTAEATTSIGFMPNLDGQTIIINNKLPIKMIDVPGAGLKREVLSLEAIAANQSDTLNITYNLPESSWLKVYTNDGNPASVIFYTDALEFDGPMPIEQLDVTLTKGLKVTVTATSQTTGENISNSITFRKMTNNRVGKSGALKIKK